MWITKIVIFMIDNDGDEQQYEEGWEPMQELSRQKDVVVSPATTEHMDIRKIRVRMLVRKDCGKSSSMLHCTVPLCNDCGKVKTDSEVWDATESVGERVERAKNEYVDMWGTGNIEFPVRSKDPNDLTDYSIFGGMTQEQLDEHDAIVEADIAAGLSCASIGYIPSGYDFNPCGDYVPESEMPITDWTVGLSPCTSSAIPVIEDAKELDKKPKKVDNDYSFPVWTSFLPFIGGKHG